MSFANAAPLNTPPYPATDFTNPGHLNNEESQNNSHNGRLPNLESPIASYLPVYDYTTLNPPTKNNRFAKEAIQGIILATPLSALFFSKENIDILQDGLRYKVFVLSKEKKLVVSRQSDMELKVVMRGIFLQYALHQPNDLIGQVKVLNGRVLDYAAKNVLSNALQYKMFRHDLETLPVPLDRSTSTNKIGTDPLIMKSF